MYLTKSLTSMPTLFISYYLVKCESCLIRLLLCINVATYPMFIYYFCCEPADKYVQKGPEIHRYYCMN